LAFVPTERIYVFMNRPKVIIYGDVSVDGRLTLAPDVVLLFGDKRWDAIAEPSNVYEWLMFTHKPQALMEGSNSFIPAHYIPEPLLPATGDPGELYQDFLPEAVIRHPAHYIWFTVVDSRGRVRWTYTGEPGKEAPGSEGQHLLVLVTHHTPAEYLAYLRREKVPYLIAGEEQVDLHQALGKLASQLGVQCVLSTSPGKLGGALLRAGLVDEINIDFFPAIIGGADVPILFDSPALGPDEWPTRLKLLAVQVQAEGRVWLRYEVVQG
jgi:2,5-diamino-6-(ribosylamino)-4(3H)-pyrimidinone 5'-phosphate reductase